MATPEHIASERTETRYLIRACLALCACAVALVWLVPSSAAPVAQVEEERP